MTQTATIRVDGDDSQSEGSSSVPSSRYCAGNCGQLIPNKRLAAQPYAKLCVQCLEAAGDVPRMRRMDEFTSDGNRIETYFTDYPESEDAQVLTRYMTRMNNSVPEPIFYGIAVGDDSELIREGDSVIDVARHLANEFDDTEEEIQAENARLVHQHEFIGRAA